MVKLFGYDIRNPFHRLEEAKSNALSADTSDGLFSRYRRTEDLYKPKEIQSYFDAYNDNDLVRGPIDDLVESALGQGYYTTVETEEGEKSKKLCDEFGKHFNLDDLLVNIGKTNIVGGFCPVETKFDTTLEDSIIKIVHPITVLEIKTENNSAEPLTIKSFKQKKVKDAFNGEDFAWFLYGRIANDPRGLSYVKGVINVLNTVETTTDNVDSILDRYLAPIIIWSTQRGRDIDALKKAVLEREDGEDIFIGDLTPEELALMDKIVQIVSIDPRVPFWEYIEYLDRRIYSYTRSNNLWYSKDATVASAEKLDEIVQRHVRSLQRSIKRGVERYWYTPLVIKRYGEEAEIPRLNFGQEQTGIEEIQVEPFLTAGLTSMDAQGPYLTRNQYYDLIKQMGFELVEPEIIGPAPIPEPEEREPREGDEREEQYDVSIRRKRETHETKDC